MAMSRDRQPYSYAQDVIEESLDLAHALDTTLAEVQMPHNDC